MRAHTQPADRFNGTTKQWHMQDSIEGMPEGIMTLIELALRMINFLTLYAEFHYLLT